MKDIQKVLSLVRRAVAKYDMISPGDRIAVGVSGGKDSMLLLTVLKEMMRFADYDYSVVAVTLDPCFENAGGVPLDTGLIKSYCDGIGVENIIVKSDISAVANAVSGGSSPCSLCAHMRRAALTEAARENGCGKLALGHNADDVAETYIMNILSCGKNGCFSPVTFYPDRAVGIIRPLIYMREHEILSFVKNAGIPVCEKSCPYDGATEREHFKGLLRSEDLRHRGVHRRIIGALERSETDGWHE